MTLQYQNMRLTLSRRLAVLFGFLFASAASAQTALTDPSGRYSLILPVGFSGIVEKSTSEFLGFLVTTNECKHCRCRIGFYTSLTLVKSNHDQVKATPDWHDHYRAMKVLNIHKGHQFYVYLQAPTVTVEAACIVLDGNPEKLMPKYKTMIRSISVAY